MRFFQRKKNPFKRHFTGSCVPLGTEFGKALINSPDSRKISEAILSLKQGETVTVQLSDETKTRVHNLTRQ